MERDAKYMAVGLFALVAVFGVLNFGLTTGLVATAVGLERRTSILEIWREHFVGLWVTYLGGIFASMLMLVLSGERGLELLERRFFGNADAAVGDVRHAMSALRFYQEFGKEIPTPRLARALRHLLSRPEFAAAAIIDLARWQDWQSREQVVCLYTADPPPAASTRRAIVGYLLNCPLPEATADLAELRRRDPRGVQEAEKSLMSGAALRQD